MTNEKNAYICSLCISERMSKSGSIKDGEKGPYDPVSTAEKGNDEIKLEAKMSLLNGVTVIVGSIIGSGIFVSPTGVLKYTGSVNASLLVWTASGIYSMVRIIYPFLFFLEKLFLDDFCSVDFYLINFFIISDVLIKVIASW